MALIRCPECGNSISDRAEKCPHCGLPASYFSSLSKNTPHMKETGLDYKNLQNVLISFERDHAQLFSAEHYISHRDAQRLRDTYGKYNESLSNKLIFQYVCNNAAAIRVDIDLLRRFLRQMQSLNRDITAHNTTYLLFVVPVTFSPSAMNFTGGIERSPFEGLTLSTFDKITRPNQTYPIFIEKSTMKIVGVGKSLAERIANGSYTGDPRDFTFDFDEAPEGAVAIWPISSKGADCVWRLISTRLLHDWELGYIKVSKNKSKACPNEYSLQYLPDGVIRKIEAGVLEIIGREDNLPTLKLGKNETVGSEIPTIWTEKDFFTTKGSTYVRNLFGDKRFPYPKPLEFIVELLRATTTDNSLIVDFFAGSGTTGEAAMLLNRETDGSRRFILCTNNENGICRDVTYERIRRVIDKEDYAASLKYYKVDYVPISDRMYYEYADELLRHIRELVELENGINFTGNEEIAIVLTDEELEIFLDDEGICKRCRKLYMGHDVLLDAQQAQALQEYNIAVNVIPDYYYKELEG